MNQKTLSYVFLSATLWLVSCADHDAKGLGVEDSPARGSVDLKMVATSFVELPSSMASVSAGVELASPQPLAKLSSATNTSSDEEVALSAYQYVPAMMHMAQQSKDSVQALLQKLAQAELPEYYKGPYEGYQMELNSRDSLLETEQGVWVRLVLKKEDQVVLRLRYVRNMRGQYRGECFFHSTDSDSLQMLLRFSNINEGALGRRMSLWLHRPASVLEDPNAPQNLRIHAVHTPKGKVVVSGATYHPSFVGDDFWGSGRKVYDFRAVADYASDKTMLSVAFADADSLTEDIFAKHALDQAVAYRATVHMRKMMHADTMLARLISYSIDQRQSFSTIQSKGGLAWALYSPRKSVEQFSAQDLESFLEINAQDIETGEDLGLKLLYFYVKVKQPIYLNSGAKIVGYEGRKPQEFPVESKELEEASNLVQELSTLIEHKSWSDESNAMANEL